MKVLRQITYKNDQGDTYHIETLKVLDDYDLLSQVVETLDNAQVTLTAFYTSCGPYTDEMMAYYLKGELIEEVA